MNAHQWQFAFAAVAAVSAAIVLIKFAWGVARFFIGLDENMKNLTEAVDGLVVTMKAYESTKSDHESRLQVLEDWRRVTEAA